MLYSDKVLSTLNPKNAEYIPADGVGTMGDSSCGDYEFISV